MNEAVDRGEGHRGVGEDLTPFAEGLVGGDQQRPTLIACAYQLEQDAGLGLVLGDIGQVVENSR
jgi:hypothetical protein